MISRTCFKILQKKTKNKKGGRQQVDRINEIDKILTDVQESDEYMEIFLFWGMFEIFII